jgi:hypothetical protein
VTVTTGQEEQVTEFRVGTVNDLLIAAKGGTIDSAGDAKRFKSLALAGGVSSAVLALALVVVLITGTGTGSKSSTKSASTTASTQKPLTLPPDTGAQPVTIPSALVSTVTQGSYVNITGTNRTDLSDVKIVNALVIAVTTETKPGLTKDAPSQTSTTAVVAIPNSQQAAFGAIDPKTLKVFASSGPSASTTAPPTTQPPATQPPATQPATTPASH